MSRSVTLLLALGLVGLSVVLLVNRSERSAASQEEGEVVRAIARGDPLPERSPVELGALGGETVVRKEAMGWDEESSSLLPRTQVSIVVREDVTGAPVPDASIEVEFHPAGSESSWRREERADPGGRLFLRLPPGRLSAVAWTENGSSHRGMLAVDGWRADELLLELAPGVTVSGVVRDAETREPLAGVLVTASTLGSRRVTTGPDGSFCFVPLPASGIGTFLDFSGAGYPAHAVLLAVDRDTRWSVLSGPVQGERKGAGSPIELAIELDAGRTVTGRVLGESGPLAGADVVVGGYLEASGIRRPVEAQGTTSSDGSFAVQGLRRDAWYLVGLASEELACAGVVVEPGEERVVDCGAIRLEEGQVLEGRLVDPVGRPVEGLQVSLSSLPSEGQRAGGSALGATRPSPPSTVGIGLRPGSDLRPARPGDRPSERAAILGLLSYRSAKLARADSNGHFAFAPVPAGVYRFECLDIAGATLVSREVRLPEQAHALFDVELDGATCVAGRVRGETGPVAGARVLFLQGAASLVVTADREGRFVAGGLRPEDPYKALGFVEGTPGSAAACGLLERMVGGGDDLDLLVDAAGP